MPESAFRAQFGRDPEFEAHAGGRVNLIGEHTDYHGGFVLPAAIDLRTRVLGATRSDGLVRVWSENLGEMAESRIDSGHGSTDGWKGYALGPFLSMAESGAAPAGADVWIEGDVPLGGGLSSSASIEVALVGLCASMAGLHMEPFDVAKAARGVEHRYCGVPCGIMDQASAACGKEGHALLIDCRSLDISPVPVPADWAIVVADSGVRHELASSEYAKRQRECARGLAAISRGRPGVETARDLDYASIEEARKDMNEVAYRRLRHVVTENERTLSAAAALESGDAGTMGVLMAGSHDSLAFNYEVSCPELDTLVDLAYGLDGVIGARLTGAGFGGNTVNLVHADRATDFAGSLADGFRTRTDRTIEVRTVKPSGGLEARRIT